MEAMSRLTFLTVSLTHAVLPWRPWATRIFSRQHILTSDGGEISVAAAAGVKPRRTFQGCKVNGSLINVFPPPSANKRTGMREDACWHTADEGDTVFWIGSWSLVKDSLHSGGLLRLFQVGLNTNKSWKHKQSRGFRDSVFVPDRQCNHFKSSGQYFSFMERLKERMHLFRNEFNMKRTKSCSQKR